MQFDVLAWAVLAMVLFIAEIFTAGFVIICFGIGAAAAALTALLGLGVIWQLLAFIVVSLLVVVLSRRLAERVTGPQVQGVGIDRVLGKEAVVIERIDPLTGAGRVRVEREEWRAESTDRTEISEGTAVEVVSVAGTRLQVKETGRS